MSLYGIQCSRWYLPKLQGTKLTHVEDLGQFFSTTGFPIVFLLCSCGRGKLLSIKLTLNCYFTITSKGIWNSSLEVTRAKFYQWADSWWTVDINRRILSHSFLLLNRLLIRSWVNIFLWFFFLHLRVDTVSSLHI
jgi:hypothetical protein